MVITLNEEENRLINEGEIKWYTDEWGKKMLDRKMKERITYLLDAGK